MVLLQPPTPSSSEDMKAGGEDRRGGSHLGTGGRGWGAVRGPLSGGHAHLAQGSFQLLKSLLQAVHPLGGGAPHCAAEASSRLALVFPAAGLGIVSVVLGGLLWVHLNSGGLLSSVQDWSPRTGNLGSSLLWVAAPYPQSLQRCPFLFRHQAVLGLRSLGHYPWQRPWAIPAPSAASQVSGSWGGGHPVARFFKPGLWWGGRVGGTFRQDDLGDTEGSGAWGSLWGKER